MRKQLTPHPTPMTRIHRHNQTSSPLSTTLPQGTHFRQQPLNGLPKAFHHQGHKASSLLHPTTQAYLQVLSHQGPDGIKLSSMRNHQNLQQTLSTHSSERKYRYDWRKRVLIIDNRIERHILLLIMG
jgi:hypothetical protein